jgi:hypothetical protein
VGDVTAVTVTTVIVEPRPARTLIRWGEGLAVDESVTIA